MVRKEAVSQNGRVPSHWWSVVKEGRASSLVVSGKVSPYIGDNCTWLPHIGG